MWMSLITSGVKIGLRPITSRPAGASPDASLLCSAIVVLLENELALARFEVVVVVELLARHEFAQIRRTPEPVDRELALDQLGVLVGPVGLHAVDAEGGDLAPDVDGAVVHRVPQPVADVAEDDLAPALQHEAGHRGGVAEHDDGAALLIDPGPRADVALDDQVATPQCRARQRPGVVLDDDDAGHHVLGHRPADAPGDLDLGPVDQPAAEVPKAALEPNPAAGQDRHAEGVTGARIAHGHVGDALLVDQPPQLGVDLARGHLASLDHRALPIDLRLLRNRVVELDEPALVHAGLLAHLLHTRTSLSYGSWVSISRSSTWRIATSSEARATMSSSS